MIFDQLLEAERENLPPAQRERTAEGDGSTTVGAIVLEGGAPLLFAAATRTKYCRVSLGGSHAKGGESGDQYCHASADTIYMTVLV